MLERNPEKGTQEYQEDIKDFFATLEKDDVQLKELVSLANQFKEALREVFENGIMPAQIVPNHVAQEELHDSNRSLQIMLLALIKLIGLPVFQDHSAVLSAALQSAVRDYCEANKYLIEFAQVDADGIKYIDRKNPSITRYLDREETIRRRAINNFLNAVVDITNLPSNLLHRMDMADRIESINNHGRKTPV